MARRPLKVEMSELRNQQILAHGIASVAVLAYELHINARQNVHELTSTALIIAFHYLLDYSKPD